MHDATGISMEAEIYQLNLKIKTELCKVAMGAALQWAKSRYTQSFQHQEPFCCSTDAIFIPTVGRKSWEKSLWTSTPLPKPQTYSSQHPDCSRFSFNWHYGFQTHADDRPLGTVGFRKESPRIPVENRPDTVTHCFLSSLQKWGPPT